jgi:hypothetical protein
MLLPQIVKTVNRYLPGEILTFNNMVVYLDEVIDDINAKLCATFPTFTEAIDAATEAAGEVINLASFNYNFFPERYIRNVVAKGAVYKFYVQDEEGIITADKYGYEYKDSMFIMERDYLSEVPNEYQSLRNASVVKDEYYRSGNLPFNFNQFSDGNSFDNEWEG